MPPPKPPVIENVSIATFFPIAVSSVALVFGTVGAIGCRMMSIPAVDPEVTPFPIEAGVFAYRDGSSINTEETELLWDKCRPYGDFEFDEKDGLMGLIQVMAIIITILGVLTVLGMWSSPCFPLHEYCWYLYGVNFVMLGVFQIITTQVGSSTVCTNNPRLQWLEENDPEKRALYEDDCIWNRGIRFTITASVLWFIAAIVTLRTPAPRKKPEPPREPRS